MLGLSHYLADLTMTGIVSLLAAHCSQQIRYSAVNTHSNLLLKFILSSACHQPSCQMQIK